MNPLHETEILSFITKANQSGDMQPEMMRLAALLNEMILHDFEALLQLLYRVDVPEQKVKQLLRQQPETDAGLLLAGMLIKRQQEKEVLRQKFQSDNTGIADEDRW